jgi:hypothetical protein
VSLLSLRQLFIRRCLPLCDVLARDTSYNLILMFRLCVGLRVYGVLFSCFFSSPWPTLA